MENNFDSNVISHSVKILERNNIFVSGTKKVHNFNENEFLINTVMGNVNIKGSNLELIKLDTNDGNICIKGKINSVVYLDNNDKEHENGFFGKLFK
ncbi:MAG: sporulation protein YabP [Bacilli bacterium]|nr:sporulation protein YabP [Bacilli bacterium]